MSIYDRWHLSHPENHPDWENQDPEQRLKPCKCGRGKNKLYPTAIHGTGKRWQVRWRDDEGNQPKRNFEFRGGGRDETDPEKYAEAFDAQNTRDLNTGDYIAPDAGSTTLKEYAQTWRASLSGDPKSLENFDSRLAHILGSDDDPTLISKIGMAKLAKKPSLIQQWVKGLEGKKLASGYIRDIANFLSSIFLAAIDDGVAAKNPVRSRTVRLPARDRHVIEPWTADMAAKARADLEKRRGCGAMVDLGVGAGLRQGEIFAIAEEDIVFLGKLEDRKIKVRRQIKMLKNAAGKRVPVFAPPKRGKERDVPLSDALGRRLAAHIKAHPPVSVTLPWKTPDGKPITVRLLFVRPDGTVWANGNIGWVWTQARIAAGAPGDRRNGMHVLRHTFASVNLHCGVDVVKVSVWLGHGDPAFTLRVYGHFIPDLTNLGRRAVDAFLEPGRKAGKGTTGDGRA
ncbi:tyrosine-type recombinase/integrase [Actinomadura litoris]|uniref:tyrosine-type recombinase/integrase n=1 Tax=Actinomadura litoris TaxID=2678616 RepID=UPI001FA6CD59|nr:tyrosine-type recombinase/integrase [Actinomadura litoris]